MAELLKIKKPTLSLIKLIESVGILLRVPATRDKSNYKAPTPSNYDKTVEILAGNFYGNLLALTSMVSSDIENKVASDFYNKLLEPGFNYEDAVNSGGLLVRELFNIVYYLLLNLQRDKDRIPIQLSNVGVLIDGCRASYVAFDTAAHIHNHGILHAITLTTSFTNSNESSDSKNKKYLINDIHRRCKQQYKLPEHAYKVLSLDVDTIESNNIHTENIEKVISDNNCDILSLGISDNNIGEDSVAALPLWAAWKFTGDVVFTKGTSHVRPFSVVNSERTFLIYLDCVNNYTETYYKAMKFMRPGDAVVLLTIAKDRIPVGDNRETRFGFGNRMGWIDSDASSRVVPDTNGSTTLEPNKIGWNDEQVEKIQENFESMISNSYMQGTIIIERSESYKTEEQIISKVAFGNGVDAIAIRVPNNRGTVIDLVRENEKSIILLK